ncbi:uncharacterized protein LOC120078676 [Benincasa hispida]|uniref:uncharacterized protein LOC120078676 n=1 Tax=Benincasa hispida TaxID=102211 RepID=UPI001900CE64|nr:uncharacterized protein LOC120078676 [Benincasa hispida]
MSNLIQESSEPQNPEEPFDPFHSRFSTLCLNPSAVDPSLCSSCARRHPRSAATPMKRPTPTPPQQHPSKNLFLDHQQPDSTFSKIDLPIPFDPSVFPLRRSVSDPTEARNFSPTPVIQSPAKRLCLNSPLPPLPLRRTVSDPNPSPEKTSDSPIKIGKDNPESKRLRRIKDRLKEMNQWWNEVMSEEQDENETKKSDCLKEEEEDEETVGVERVGDSLALHLKCSCGKGFEILLSGRSCFYKLL